MAHLMTWSFSDLAFSKLLLDELTGSQMYDFQHQANEVGALSMEAPPQDLSPGSPVLQQENERWEQGSGSSSDLILKRLWALFLSVPVTGLSSPLPFLRDGQNGCEGSGVCSSLGSR